MYRALRRTFRDDDFTGVVEGGRPAAEGAPLANVDGHRIYIAGWKLGPELWMPDFAPEADPVPTYDGQANMVSGAFDPRGHVMGILRAAIASGVAVRALLWRQQQENPVSAATTPPRSASSTSNRACCAATRSSTPRVAPSVRITRRRW